MAKTWIFLLFIPVISKATTIELLECEPPDFPILGGYGPQQESYIPGDMIHYYCDTDTFIGGNFLRKCEDTGDWSGHTPVCDRATAFSSFSQTSEADEDSSAELAIDGLRNTCSGTSGGQKDEWFGNFTKQGELIRVMLFLPKGPISLEVILVKPNGEELLCGSHTRYVDRHDWLFQNCPGPHNTGASGLKIRSLTNEPLRICEIVAHVLVSPKCVDPKLRIDNGRLRMNRSTAILRCNRGYTKSKDDALNCAYEGVWNRKQLYCIEREWELEGGSNGGDNRRTSTGHRPEIDSDRLET